MVVAYVPEAGDIVTMDFDPQVRREQSKRRPALVLTDDHVESARSRRLKIIDWAGRKARFHSKAEPGLLSKTRQYIAVLLAIRG